MKGYVPFGIRLDLSFPPFLAGCSPILTPSGFLAECSVVKSSASAYLLYVADLLLHPHAPATRQAPPPASLLSIPCTSTCLTWPYTLSNPQRPPG
eukprot:765537-Hanusia_phi.AAC.4